MFGGLEWLAIIIIILVLIGGPNLVRELGKAIRETRENVEKVKTNIRESAQEIIVESADPLRVFVCSMQEETASERAAIRYHLKRLGKLTGLTRPILFEQIPASPDNPEEIYREAVERCDVFVIIVAEDISAPVLREYQFAVKYKKPCFFFRKDTQNQSDALRRFLADINQKWVSYNEPNELASQVVLAIVLDIIKNYRQYRLTKSDAAFLFVFYNTLDNNKLSKELLEDKTDIEVSELLQKLSHRPEYNISLEYVTKNFTEKEIELLSIQLSKIGYKTTIHPIKDASLWLLPRNEIIYADQTCTPLINEIIICAKLDNIRLCYFNDQTKSANKGNDLKNITIQFCDRSIFLSPLEI